MVVHRILPLAGESAPYANIILKKGIIAKIMT